VLRLRVAELELELALDVERLRLDEVTLPLLVAALPRDEVPFVTAELFVAVPVPDVAEPLPTELFCAAAFD
jgi:hypothetical protein